MEVEFLTAKEAAKFLKVTERTLYNYRQLELGPSYMMIKGKLIYPKKDLIKFLERITK